MANLAQRRFFPPVPVETESELPEELEAEDRTDDFSPRVVLSSLAMLSVLGLATFAFLYNSVHAGHAEAAIGAAMSQPDSPLGGSSAAASALPAPSAPSATPVRLEAPVETTYLAPAPPTVETTSPQPPPPARAAAHARGAAKGRRPSVVVRVEPNPVLNPYAGSENPYAGPPAPER